MYEDWSGRWMDQGDAFLAIYKANFGNAIFKKNYMDEENRYQNLL